MPQVVIPDMSVAAKAGQGVQQPSNLLTMGQQALGIRGQQLENQNIGNQLTGFQAKQAASRDYLQSLGANGQVDPVLLNRNLQADPTAALAAPDLMQQAQANYIAQLQAKGLTLDQGIKRMKWAGDAAGALLAQPGGPTQSAVRETLIDGVKDGIFSAQEAASTLSSLPPNGPQLNAWVKAHFAAAQGGLDALLRHVAPGENGAYSFLRQTNPLAPGFGKIVAGSAVPNQLSPAQAAQPVTLPTPSGAGQVTTLGQFDAAANGGAAPKIVATGPSTQQQAANQVAGTAQGNQAASVVADSTNLAQTRAALQGIRVELPNANGGPLSDLFRNVGATLGELGIAGMNQATAFDLLQKGQAQVVVSRVADGLGVPTDGKMAALSAQTPGTHMTGTAGAVAVGQIEGVLDYQYARAKAAQAAGVTANPASSSQFNLEWQGRFPNAAVFQFPYLPRKFQQEYWHSMSAREQKAFRAEYRDAAEAGYVRPDPFNNQ